VTGVQTCALPISLYYKELRLIDDLLFDRREFHPAKKI